jgi:hypothetical protein
MSATISFSIFALHDTAYGGLFGGDILLQSMLFSITYFATTKIKVTY